MIADREDELIPSGIQVPEASSGDDLLAPPTASAGILLVDDHPDNLTALQAVLEPLGERLVTAESGEQALRALLREEIAVILLDVRMAGMDGLQTARIIRTRPGTRHIPIIFLTAQASDVGEIARAYATGAVDYVVKPFEPDILRAKVSVFVELSRERAERVRQSHARAQAEAAARTIRTLQTVSDTALAHLDLDELVIELLERAREVFGADGAALLLTDEEAPGLSVRGARGHALPLPGDGRVVPAADSLDPLARLAATERTTRLPAGEVGPTPLLAAPLVSARERLGLLLLGAVRPEAFRDTDLELLTLASDRMAIAIDHAQRSAQGRELVETLQRSLLPESLPRHPRLALAARYLPSGLSPEIGGDWYDALELGADRMAIMIGDVVGHGVRAATRMSELRNALRAFAIEGHRPSEALHQLDRVVGATLGRGMVATALFVLLDVAEGTVSVARAGHPPAALRGVDGSVRFLETDGTLPLGVNDRQAPTELECPIRPGETLLLFTDGLVERRGESLNAGFERLREALAGAPDDVEALCDHVVECTAAPEHSHDDVALLAVRVLAHPPGPLELTLPARAESIPLARHRLRAWLRNNVPQLDRVVRGDLEVAFSEACSNAVRHAYGPVDANFTAVALLEPDVVCLEVRDRGSWRPPRATHGGRGLMLLRALCEELEIDRRPDGTTVRMRVRISGPATPGGGADR